MRTPDGQIYGPVERTELDSWAREGRVSSQCQLQSTDDSRWINAAELYPELQSATPVASQAGAAPYNPTHYVGSGHPYPRPVTRAHNGVPILVFGILSIVLAPIVVFSLVAMFWGASELKAINRGQADPSGKSMVQAGYFLGIVGLVLFFLVCCCGIPLADF